MIPSIVVKSQHQGIPLHGFTNSLVRFGVLLSGLIGVMHTSLRRAVESSYSIRESRIVLADKRSR